MLTIQIHRTEGPDEDFEAGTVEEAKQIVRDARRDPDVRRIVAITACGRVTFEEVR